MYKELEIRQNKAGQIHLYLDGAEVKGCRSASLDMEVNSIPTLTMTVMCENVKVGLPCGAEVDSEFDGQMEI